MKYRVLSIVGIIALYSILYTPYSAYAAESTPSASIKSKLDALKLEIASKAAKLKAEVNQKLQNKAYIGTVKTKSTNTLTLASQGGPKLVTLNQDTVYESKVSKKKFSATLIQDEDFVVALGDIDDESVLIARKLILLPTPTEKSKNSLWGQVIVTSDKLITIKDRDSKNHAISVSTKTKLKKGVDEITLSDIKNTNFIIVSGNLNDNDIMEASLVYVIPQGGFIKQRKLATPSAQISSPSAKKKN